MRFSIRSLLVTSLVFAIIFVLAKIALVLIVTAMLTGPFFVLIYFRKKLTSKTQPHLYLTGFAVSLILLYVASTGPFQLLYAHRGYSGIYFADDSVDTFNSWFYAPLEFKALRSFPCANDAFLDYKYGWRTFGRETLRRVVRLVA
ncbi:hypothetical protein LF1_55080 [Rubripirellula obstinata]|uniref:Uncharacterized protein n=1 Tax=Rubripirellula obstinata TaxID=406547 RepID=A0A5B1C7M4_9BACT|nr:hypothetical protein [Rubripirellula obstinata]KAA1257108.1 hypothetical protein LF1_55080 [Rubripirellula obstinata]